MERQPQIRPTPSRPLQAPIVVRVASDVRLRPKTRIHSIVRYWTYSTLDKYQSRHVNCVRIERRALCQRTSALMENGRFHCGRNYSTERSLDYSLIDVCF